MNLKSKKKFVSPNQKLTDYYSNLIENNPNEFFEMLDKGQVNINCLTPTQQKIIKKRKSKNIQSESRFAIKYLWNFIKEHKIVLVFLVFATIILTVLNSLAVFGLKELTELVDQNFHQSTDSKVFAKLSIYAGVLLTFYFVSSILNWWQTRTVAIISQRIGYTIRQRLFRKIQKLPVKYFDENSSGDLMSKFTNDVNNVTNAMSQNSTTLLNAIFTILAFLISMFLMSPYLTLITLGLLPLMFIPVWFITKKSQPLFKKMQSSLGQMNGFVEEMVSGQSFVSAYNCEDQVYQQFETLNHNLDSSSKKGLAMSSVIFPYSNFFINLVTALITLIGIVFVIKGINFAGVTLNGVNGLNTNQPSSIISGIAIIAAFSLMARNFFQPFSQVANVSMTLQMALAGASRSFKIFDERNEFNLTEKLILKIVTNSETTFDGLNVQTNGEVKVENLNFGYRKDKQILHDINIEAKEGQMIAIVGPTGSGKSTFINLLTKFYDIEEGDIKIGGNISIKDITKISMRKNVSIVLQDTYLFNVSIKQNIRYGKMDATDEEVIEAAKIANAHNFIMQLPNGYDTVLDDNGESLSQGQRQLLAIARAALAPSNLLILDEATSSIDTKTEIEIQTAMLRLMKNKTSFVIAHRLSTIQNADQILVLKDGQIIERGTHQELLNLNGFYSSLYNSQFRQE